MRKKPATRFLAVLLIVVMLLYMMGFSTIEHCAPLPPDAASFSSSSSSPSSSSSIPSFSSSTFAPSLTKEEVPAQHRKPTSASSTTTTTASSAKRSARGPPVLEFPWRHKPSPPADASFFIISAGRDHRALSFVVHNATAPPTAQLRQESLAFAELAAPAAGSVVVIVQIHMAVRREFLLAGRDKMKARDDLFPAPDLFSTAELTVIEQDEPLWTTTRTLAAHTCVPIIPIDNHLRIAVKSLPYQDLVARCAFVLDQEEQLAPFLNEAGDQARDGAWLVVHAANATARLPLADVFHFPRARPLLAPAAAQVTGGFPSAPWRANRQRALEQGSLLLFNEREDEEDDDSSSKSQPRVAAVCTKKYSWNEDDVLWALWTLDVVGVDHIILGVVSSKVELSTVRASLARHPGLSERVTLVDVQVPHRQTYNYLLEDSTWDTFVRWQADFDFAFIIDTDEFVNLFDDATSPTPARLDVKSFIARNRAQIEAQGSVYFKRPRVQRSVGHGAEEPLLGSLLDESLLHDGRLLAQFAGEWQGKSLFWFPAAVRPYLHYNFYSPRAFWPPAQAHIAHVRFGNRTKGERSLDLADVLDQWRLEPRRHIAAE